MENKATMMQKEFDNLDSLKNSKKSTVVPLGTVKAASSWLRKNKTK